MSPDPGGVWARDYSVQAIKNWRRERPGNEASLVPRQRLASFPGLRAYEIISLSRILSRRPGNEVRQRPGTAEGTFPCKMKI